MHPQEQSIIINQQGQKLLTDKAQKISEACSQFIQQILTIINMGSQVPYNSQYLSEDYFSSKFNAYFTYPKQITSRPICAKVLLPHDMAFRCYECQMQQNSIICLQCFSKSDHKGHDYQKIAVAGGCCDCGDDQKWKACGSCIQHNKTDYNIKVDQDTCQSFTHDMQFVLQIILILKKNSDFPHGELLEKLLRSALADYLQDFNEDSMINNEICFRFLKSTLDRKLIETFFGEKISNIKTTCLKVILNMYNDEEFIKKINNVFISMFTRPDFKKYLTTEYNNLVSKNPFVLESELSGMSCQIYTSHKIISQLIDSKTLKPISIPKMDEYVSFDRVTGIYSRFYIDLFYLVNLCNEVGRKYVEYHLSNSDICLLTGYDSHTALLAENINYYGIQKIYFNNLFPFLILAKSNKQLLLKSMRDIVNHLQYSQQKAMELYISKQRTLMLLIYIYCEGQIQKALNTTFIQRIGMGPELLYRILQAVLYVIRFYAVLLSNKPTVERYFTFFSFSLMDKPRTLFSLDAQLLRFCIQSLSLYKFFSISQIPSEPLLYQSELTFEQSKFSIPSLLSLPILNINSHLQQIEETSDGNYDRKKALSYLTDYIGLMQQVCITNHSQLNLKFQIGEVSQKELHNFYGSLLISMGNVKIEHFRDTCEIFLNDTVVVDDFIKLYCQIENKKIKIKTEFEDTFKKINLSYLKSKKLITPFSFYLEQNLRETDFRHIPEPPPSPQALILKQTIFNSEFIDKIIQIAVKYLDIMKSSKYILENDMGHFQKYIEQILKLSDFVKSQNIKMLFQNFMQNHEQIADKMDNRIIKQIKTFMGEMQSNSQYSVLRKQSEQEQRKTKLKQLKNKKMNKFLQKQKIAIASLSEPNTEQPQSEQTSSSHTCMFCKESQEKEALSIMCFTNQTNLFSQQFLNCSRKTTIITSCGHMTHNSCHKKINKNRTYFNCNFCQTCSNSLIEKQMHKPNQEQHEQQTKQQSFSFLEQNNKPSQTPIDQKQTDFAKDIQTITHSIVYGVVIDYRFFLRSMAKPCSYLLRAIKKKKMNVVSLISSIKNQFQTATLEKKQCQFWQIFMLTMVLVFEILNLDKQSSQLSESLLLNKSTLSEGFKQTIICIIKTLAQQQNFYPLEELTVLQIGALKFRQIPPTLYQLSLNIGECPCCSRITNQICLCLQCDFFSCLSCQICSLTSHVEKKHPQGSIFIQADQGRVLYVTKKKNAVFKPVYNNFMGEFFVMEQIKTKSRQDYAINEEEYQKVKQDLVKHRIEQKIRYNELFNNKQSNLIP